MSIWSSDLGYSSTWPDWFVEYRRAQDAELNATIAAHHRGAMTEGEFKTWALEHARKQQEWIEALPADRRAWIQSEESRERTIAVAAGTNRIDLPGLHGKGRA